MTVVVTAGTGGTHGTCRHGSPTVAALRTDDRAPPSWPPHRARDAAAASVGANRGPGWPTEFQELLRAIATRDHDAATAILTGGAAPW